MPRRSLSVVVLLLLAAPLAAPAQARPSTDTARAAEPFVHESWTVRDGLPVNSVTALLQGRSGYLWIATFDGLARFDGVRVTVFKAASSPGLPSYRILRLKETGDGTLWLETEQHQLVRFRSGAFTAVAPARSAGGRLLALEESRSGALWVGSDVGLGIVRGDSVVAVAPAVMRGAVAAVIARRDGSVWAATVQGDVFRIVGERGARVIPATRFDGDSVLALLEDARGTLWIGSSGALWRWRDSLARDSLERVVRSPGDGFGVLLESPSAREVWAGTLTRVYRVDSDGVARVLGTGVHGRSFWHNLLFPDRSGHALFFDERAPGRDGRGPASARAYADALATVDAELSGALIDHEGSLWIGTYYHGLHRLKPTPVHIVADVPGVRVNEVYAVLAARDGSVWYGAGPYVVRVANGQARVVQRDIGVGDWVRSFVEDDSGRVWVGGRLPLEVCTARAMRCDRAPGAPTNVLAMYADAAGTMWAGTLDGLFRRVAACGGVCRRRTARRRRRSGRSSARATARCGWGRRAAASHGGRTGDSAP